MHTCRYMRAHTHILCEIPLAGRACRLSGAGLHQRAAAAIYRSHHSRLSDPLIYFPSLLLFCINRITGFLFLKCFFSRTAHPHCCPWKGYAHVSFFSILSVSPAERKRGRETAKDMERERERERERDSPSWLRMIKSSGLSRPAGTDDTTKLQRVKDSGRRKKEGAGAGGRENTRKEIAILNLFRQIDVE